MCVSWKIFEMKLKSSKFLSTRSIAFYLGVSEQTKRLTTQNTAYVFCNRERKQVFVRKNEKKVFLKFCKIHKKTPAPGFLENPEAYNFNKKETLAVVFLWIFANFQEHHFWLHMIHWLALHCDKIVVKCDVHRKILTVESIHIAIQTLKQLN